MYTRVMLLSAALVLAGCTGNATCRRMKDLCGTEEPSCKDMLASAQNTFGEKGVAAVEKCFADAKSCSEASGCVAGAGLKNLQEAAGDFVKGLNKALESPKKE